MKKIAIIILPILAIIALILGLILADKNKELAKNKLQIIDATYRCDNNQEKLYEDDLYIYYFPCTKSTTVYLKYPNGNKILVKTALEEKKVTINELIKIGLNVIKEKK